VRSDQVKAIALQDTSLHQHFTDAAKKAKKLMHDKKRRVKEMKQKAVLAALPKEGGGNVRLTKGADKRKRKR
jgi:hypothetical protein